jgi:hypothetical protein
MRLSTAISLAALAAALPLAPATATTYRGTLQQCTGGQQLQLRAGQRYTITATATAFDTVLRIVRRGGSDVLAENDDGGDGTNSRLTFSPSETGTYIACVTAFAAGGNGAYSVSVENAPPLAPAVSRPTGAETSTWQVFDGTLADGDQQDGDSRFDDYQIVIPTGQRALISAESPAFDTVVKVYRADQRGGETVATDDDGGGHLSSFLNFAPEEGGTFIVRVTSFGAHGAGAYRLRVTQMPIPPAPASSEGAATPPESGD